MELISSRSNPKIKEARSLRQHKARLESGLFLVEGIRHIGEAIDAQAQLAYIIYAPGRLRSDYANELIQGQLADGLPCYAVTDEVFESLAEKENPQGILAVVHQPETKLSDLTPNSFSWGVGLVDPQDPGNVGAILRTIDSTRASGLLLISSAESEEGLVDPYQPGCVRASMGSIFWHPLIKTSFFKFSQWANQHHYHVYGTSAHAVHDYKSIEGYEKPSILLMGSERQGLTPEQSLVCEKMIRLPMRGRVSSLNLAVATGIFLYEMLCSYD